MRLNMKKSYKIIIVIILVIAIVGIGIYFILNKNVKKLSNVEILDSYEIAIDDYNQNNMPFTIKRHNDNQKIKVNGKQYNDGERFYKVGKYKIEVTENFKTEKAVMEIKDIDRNSNNEYNIYINSLTLPSFMAMLDISIKENVKGYYWTQKPTSVDLESLKSQNKDFVVSEYVGNTNEIDFKLKAIPEMKNYIKEVLTNDKNAFFNLYVDDYRFYLDQELFGKIGLGDNRYNYYYYSDGTSSYVKNFTNKTSFIYRTYKMREENGYQDFLTEKEEYENLVDGIRNNTLKYNDIPGSYMTKEDQNGYVYDYMLISLLKDNVKYYLQYPEMIDFKDERVANEMKKANFVQMDLKKQFSALTEAQKEKFLNNIYLDKSEFDQKYFKNENDKYLIITGTNSFYGDLTKEEFESIMKQVKADYGEEYTLLYKPHPSALPNDEQQSFLDSLNIKVLPGSMPMEAIMFVYPNIKLGGFASSLYLSAEKGQTLFFFAKESSELVSPLDVLYADLFSNAKFYN